MEWEARFARIVQERGHEDSARHYYRRILKANPADIPALVSITTLHIKRSSFAAARDSASKLLKLAPKLPEAHNTHGQLLAASGDHLAAAAAYDRALELEACYFNALINHAMLRLEAKNYPSAIEYFRRVLDYAPHNMRARQGLAAGLFHTKDYSNAAATFEQVLKFQPYRHNSRLALGDCYWQAGEHERARDQYLTVKQRAPNNHVAYRKMARYYLRKGKKQRGRDLLIEALQLNPDDEMSKTMLQKLDSGPIRIPVSDILKNM